MLIPLRTITINRSWRQSSQYVIRISQIERFSFVLHTNSNAILHFISDLVITIVDTDPDEWIENQFLYNAPVSFSDQEKCCLFLIEHGANVNLHNEVVDRMSLLNTAVYYDLDRIADALIKAGADLNSVNGQVFTIYA